MRRARGPAEGVPLRRRLRFEHPVVSLQATDAALLALADAAGNVRFIDLEPGRLLNAGSFAAEAQERFSAAAFTPSGSHCAAVDPQGNPRIYSVRDRRIFRSPGDIRTSVSVVAFAPAGALLYCGYRDGRIIAWNLETAQRALNLSGHTDVPTLILCDGESDRVLSAGRDKCLILNHPATSRPAVTLRGQGSVPTAALPIPRGLVSGDETGDVVVWDLASGKPKTRFHPGRGAVTALCTDPDRRLLFAGTQEGCVVLFDLERQVLLDSEYRRCDGAVTAMAYCGAQGILAVATGTGTLELLAPLAEEERLEKLLGDGAYAVVSEALRANPALSGGKVALALQRVWEACRDDVSELITEERFDTARALLRPFETVHECRLEAAGFEKRIASGEVMAGHVENGRYAAAYAMIPGTPELAGSRSYKAMEGHWERSCAAASRLLGEQREEEAQAMLLPFRGIGVKAAAIRKLVEEGRRYAFFRELVRKQEWKKACELLRHHGALEGTEAHKSLVATADALFIAAHRALGAGELRIAREACETLLAFPDFKADASELLGRIKGASA